MAISGDDITEGTVREWIELKNTFNEKDGEYKEFFSSKVVYKDLSLTQLGIWGMPHQFNITADVPLGEINEASGGNKIIGRTFEDRIITNAPIVYFEVGVPEFLGKLNGDKSLPGYVIEKVLGAADGVTDIFDGKEADGIDLKNKTNKLRYYEFKNDFNNYANHVNAMVRFTAIKMGLGHTKCKYTDGGDLAYNAFDIRKVRNRLVVSSTLWDIATQISPVMQMIDIAASTAGELIRGAQSINWHIPFYCNAQGVQVTESASNTTGESLLAQTLKSSGQLAKELTFILGTAISDDIISENTSNLRSKISDLTSGLDGNAIGNLLSNVTNAVGTIVSGANMMMPLIWQDSAFTRNYSLNISLHTPYGDPESVLLDIYVPLFCILAMTLPRQSSEYGYSAPFIVKCYCKGYFNCDLGMIDSVEIKRGGQNNQAWTVDNLPTELDITINIKDLYPALIQTQASTASFAFSGNTGLVEYLNMTAGLNLCEIRPASNLAAAINMVCGDIVTIPSNIKSGISGAIYNAVKKVTSGFFS